MDTLDFLDPAVRVFSLRGYRKTAMDDLASALRVSRQLLYNRFGSKRALADWAAEALVERSLAEALGHVAQPSRTLTDRLFAALDAWVGQHMDASRASPYSADILLVFRRELDDRTRNAERKLVAAMAGEIRLSGAGSAVARAGSIAQALCWTARGLVHAVPDHAVFRRQMEQILDALIGR